jgi:hypothetical protein
MPRGGGGAQAFDARWLTDATSSMALGIASTFDFTDVWPG